MAEAQAALLAAFDQQVAWCRAPAPFTARVLLRSRQWLARDQNAAAAFAALADDPLAAAVALRWAAALHHLALRGLSPWAGLWPPGTEEPTDAALDSAIARAWAEQRAHCDAALALPPQTNEVQRSAALLPGLLHVAAQTGLPLVLLEIGASGGLNLWCERYHHQSAVWSWGDPQSALTLHSDWSGPAPATAARLRIDRRAGCDANPIDLTDAGQALRLASFIWPEQPERLARLRSACAAARGWLADEGLAVEQLPAADFVARELGSANLGRTTVLMHSVVWQYIAAAEQQAIRQTVENAGQRATDEAPLAWLRFEPPQPDVKMELRCRLWPGGQDQLLARCHPHGASIEWMVDPIEGARVAFGAASPHAS